MNVTAPGVPTRMNHPFLPVLLVCLTGFVLPAAFAQQPDENALADTVLKAIGENRAKITVGYVQWNTRLIKNNGPAGVIETRGQHEMWWQGENVATRSWEQRAVPSEGDGGQSIRWRGR